jgi:hypothetical protein
MPTQEPSYNPTLKPNAPAEEIAYFQTKNAAIIVPPAPPQAATIPGVNLPPPPAAPAAPAASTVTPLSPAASAAASASNANTKFCATTYFATGSSPPPVPAGCVAIAVDDLIWLSSGSTSVLYVCSIVNVNIGYRALVNYGMIDSSTGLSKISYLVPGPQTTAAFYSGQAFDGQSYTFTSAYHEEITHYHYANPDVEANDNINSIKITSTATSIDDLPIGC